MTTVAMRASTKLCKNVGILLVGLAALFSPVAANPTDQTFHVTNFSSADQLNFHLEKPERNQLSWTWGGTRFYSLRQNDGLWDLSWEPAGSKHLGSTVSSSFFLSLSRDRAAVNFRF